MQINLTQKKKGFTLVETVIYMTLLGLLSGVAVGALLLLNQSIQRVVLGRIVDDAAQEVMEKVVREVRGADSVDLVQSVLSVNPSVLVLHTTDSLGADVSVGFSIDSSALELSRDGVLVGPLTPNQVTINEFIVDHIITPQTEAVKISLVLEADRAGVHIEEPFNTTVVLRGSY